MQIGNCGSTCGAGALGQASQDATASSAATLQRKATQGVMAALRKRLGGDSVANAAASASSSPMQSLVATVHSAMSVSGASGADPVPDLLQAIRAALSDAYAALTKAGVSDQDANKAVAAVAGQLASALAPAVGSTQPAPQIAPATDVGVSTPVAAAAATPAGNSDYALTYTRKQKASLDILTQEGDRVQIRFRSREGVSTDTAAAAGGKVYAFAQGRVEISVQGELSGDELKAIGDLVSHVDTLANEFFKGDMHQAFATAAALGFDSSQIASFALQLSQDESLRQSGTLPAPAKPALPAAPAAATSAALTPTAASTAKVATGAKLPANTTPISLPEPRALDAVASAVTPSDATASDSTAGDSTTSTGSAAAPSSTASAITSPDKAPSLQDTLIGFVRKILDNLGNVAGSGRVEFSLRWKLNLVVAAVAAAAPQAAQASNAGTTLLTQSLQDVAKQSPSNTVANPVADSAIGGP